MQNREHDLWRFLEIGVPLVIIHFYRWDFTLYTIQLLGTPDLGNPHTWSSVHPSVHHRRSHRHLCGCWTNPMNIPLSMIRSSKCSPPFHGWMWLNYKSEPSPAPSNWSRTWVARAMCCPWAWSHCFGRFAPCAGWNQCGPSGLCSSLPWWKGMWRTVQWTNLENYGEREQKTSYPYHPKNEYLLINILFHPSKANTD